MQILGNTKKTHRSQKVILRQHCPLNISTNFNVFIIKLLKQLLQTSEELKMWDTVREKETKSERERRHAILYSIPAIHPEQVNDSNVLRS